MDGEEEMDMKHDRIGIAAVLMTSIIALSAFGGGGLVGGE